MEKLEVRLHVPEKFQKPIDLKIGSLLIAKLNSSKDFHITRGAGYIAFGKIPITKTPVPQHEEICNVFYKIKDDYGWRVEVPYNMFEGFN